MKLTEEERQTIIKYRLERAKEALLDVDISIKNNRWHNAANRLYYSCFYAVMALLIKDRHEARTHSGVMTLLGKNYIKSGIIAKETGQVYRKTFNLRQTGDYDDLKIITEQDVAPLIEPAKKFIQEIESLINLKAT